MSEPSRFHHLQTGTPESAWARVVGRAAPVAAPGPAHHLVVLAAHPDDETLGAGGLIATSAAAGARVTVVVATAGEGSHPDSSTVSRTELAVIRRRELYAALTELAPNAEIQLLGLPDGHLAEHVEDLVAGLTVVGAGTYLVTPWAEDGHPDHEACARAGAMVSERVGATHWQYPLWAWHWARPGEDALPHDRLRAVRLGAPAVAAKTAAIACHASQHQPLSPAGGDEPILHDGMLAHFRRDCEIFVAIERGDSGSRGYFEQLYARDADPWGLGERFYEQRKRAILLASLPRPRFRRAFEPGCAIGLLSIELARRCDEVVAWDIARPAVEQTWRRLAPHGHARASLGAIPDEWPQGHFDLIVLSEVAYYCHDLDALRARLEAALTPDGVLVACHWRHPAPLHPHSAATVHAALGAGRHLVASHVEDDFLLEMWTRTSMSVATAEGIVP